MPRRRASSRISAYLDSAGYFEQTAQGRDGKIAANWVINELFGRLKKDERDIADSPVTPACLGGIIDLITSEAINGKTAKDVFEITYTTGRDPAEIVETESLTQVTDTGAIEAAVIEIIAANPDQVAKARENPKLAGWFVGQVMKATGGKANPKVVNDLVAEKLKG
jgi:aspartyl-tRNA(Asn)/glutamyl-tRNA(Gln) amidotransferase subunit B